jgi:hypothetical protein
MDYKVQHLNYQLVDHVFYSHDQCCFLCNTKDIHHHPWMLILKMSLDSVL